MLSRTESGKSPDQMDAKIPMADVKSESKINLLLPAFVGVKVNCQIYLKFQSFIYNYFIKDMDPSEVEAMIANLPPNEQAEARKAMEAAARAEERALLRQKERDRAKLGDVSMLAKSSPAVGNVSSSSSSSAPSTAAPSTGKITFVSKKKRAEMAKREAEEKEKAEADAAREKVKEKRKREQDSRHNGGGQHRNNGGGNGGGQQFHHLNNMQVDEIRRHYIGRTEEEMEQDHNRKKEKKMKEVSRKNE